MFPVQCLACGKHQLLLLLLKPQLCGPQVLCDSLLEQERSKW